MQANLAYKDCSVTPTHSHTLPAPSPPPPLSPMYLASLFLSSLFSLFVLLGPHFPGLSSPNKLAPSHGGDSLGEHLGRPAELLFPATELYRHFIKHSEKAGLPHLGLVKTCWELPAVQTLLLQTSSIFLLSRGAGMHCGSPSPVPSLSPSVNASASKPSLAPDIHHAG